MGIHFLRPLGISTLFLAKGMFRPLTVSLVIFVAFWKTSRF